MIPSSPRRTLLFLFASSLAYFGPDMVVPAAWAHRGSYLLVSAIYQGALLVAGFWFGPGICRALVLREVVTGPLPLAIRQAQAALHGGGLSVPPIVLFEHPALFVITAGLRPNRCAVFLSAGLAARLGPPTLQYLLARAAVHATWPQRLGALVPALIFTVLLPDDLKVFTTWLELGGFLILWLLVHWGLELDVDRRAAGGMATGATEALRELLAVTHSRAGWVTLQPPLAWRLRAVRG